MAGYVFLSNSTRPSRKEQYSREEVKLTNVCRPCLKTALEMGYNVFWGVNRDNPEGLPCELTLHMYDSHTYRSIFDFKSNWIAYKNLMTILKNNDIEVIHCNTPIGGVMGRICGKRMHVKKIIYTAHGFHFYQGAPLINRTIFKWAERLMAHWTDVIITMNQEDYESAQKFHLKKNGKVYKIHGVGISIDEYKNMNVDREEIRLGLGLKNQDIICISAGDLVSRKNYVVAIKAIALLKDSRVHYVICGIGPEKDNLKKLAKKLHVENQVHFLGFRTDIKELLFSADIFLFTSLQEGLPRSLMEAMACGLPCVVSNIRGNVDLIEGGKGGVLCEAKDAQSFANAIKQLSNSDKMRERMGAINKENVKKYDINVVNTEIKTIYSKELENKLIHMD